MEVLPPSRQREEADEFAGRARKPLDNKWVSG
jgi:hypothetical protein